MVEALTASAIDQQYDVFCKLVDSSTPDEAIKQLEIIGVAEDLIQRIVDRHEREAIKIREREEPRSLVLGNRFTWYTGPRRQDTCWPAMVSLLLKTGWPKDPSINDLDAASTKVVSLLSHPKERAFTTRGLVVGHVQSGKTTNFTAVMAKAADRGYKLFIVFAGIHNGLRRQTQLRLVQQLVEPNPSRWMQLTDPDRDFVPPANAAAYFARTNRQHVLCVVKKNARVLRKFRNWLGSAAEYLKDCPALIIDDEADQATVATKTINPLIREILDRLPKSAYVGYTATPFANLLIDPAAEDLYPEHFIVNLPKPLEHFGTEVLFGREPLDGEEPEEAPDGHDMIRLVPDHEVEFVRPKKRSDAESFVPDITKSLRTAVLYFWLSTAARRTRGSGTSHSTMLIHTSVNIAVHESFRRPLEALRSAMLAGIPASGKALFDELKFLWESEITRVPANDFGEQSVQFSELLPQLSGVLEDCKVVMDNYSSKDRLDYENGPVIAIAVGGNTLSRGLTLEGLSVSYFVRAVSAYDTLLQMGRWFGYRQGYADLPRIWMTEELREWFRHLATVESEMRRDIDVYMVEDKTPKTFAVRLRTHPALRVTTAAKMKDAVTAASAYGGQRIQTRYFKVDDRDWLLNNQVAAKVLVTKAVQIGVRREEHLEKGRYLLRDVPYDLIFEFLDTYRFHEKSQECDGGLLRRYIEKRIVSASALRMWNVAIIGNPTTHHDQDLFKFAPGIAIKHVNRARLPSQSSEMADIKTLMSRRDAAIDLDTSAVPPGGLDEETIKELRRRQCPDMGLLVLYPIDKISEPSPARKQKNARMALNAKETVIGIGLVFPLPKTGDTSVEWNYVSADLSKVEIEEEDLSALELEDLG